MKSDNLKDLFLYQSQNTNKTIEVLYDNEDFWLTQKTMAELFNVKVNTINYHLKEVFFNNELNENSVIRKIRITAKDGRDYNTNFYSLDAVIAVGYRANSKEATDFRIWATNTLKEYIKKRLYGISNMACLREMTRQLKIVELLYFKGETENNHITIEADENNKTEYDFNIRASIIE